MLFPTQSPVTIKNPDWLRRFFESFHLHPGDLFFEKLYKVNPNNEQRTIDLFSIMKNRTHLTGCFAGAGISKPYDMPAWGEFLTNAAKSMNSYHLVEKQLWDFQYPEVAQILEDVDIELFEQFIQKTFSHRQIRAELLGAGSILPFLPFQFLVTTNFDNVLEAIYQLAGITIKPVIYGANPIFAKAAQRDDLLPLLKIHGDYLNERILTKKQYEDSYSRNSPLLKYLEELFSSISFLFIGFSFQDEEIKIALKEAFKRPDPKPHFVILPTKSRDWALSEDEKYVEMGVFPIWYEGDHSQVNKILGFLAHSYHTEIELWKIGYSLKNDYFNDEAVSICEKLARMRPHCNASKLAYAIALTNNSLLGTKLSDISEVNKSISKVDRAIGIVIDFGDAYMVRGMLNIFRFEVDEAIEDFTLALQYDVSDKAAAYSSRGLYRLIFQCKMSLAKEDISAAIVLIDPTDKKLLPALEFYLNAIDFIKGDEMALYKLQQNLAGPLFDSKDMRSTKRMVSLFLKSASPLKKIGLLKPLLRFTSKTMRWQGKRGASFTLWMGRAGLLKRWLK